MTFSQDRNLEQNVVGRETDIFSNSFGGLNTLASPLNMPYEDSPLMENVDVLISGVLQKRRGTRVVYKESGLLPSEIGGVAVVPFSTGLGYNFIVQKKQRDIRIMSAVDDDGSVLMTKSNVWDADGGNIRATYVTIADVEPKLVFCTGVNRPVQLKFVERQISSAIAAASASIVFPGDTRFINSTTSNLLVFQDRRLKRDVTSVVYSGGSTTVTFSSPVPAGSYTFDVILIVWSWHAEAYIYDGDRFFKSVTQLTSANSGATGNTNDPDQVISIPDTLRDDILPDSNLNYPILAYQSTAHNDNFTLSTTRNPSSSSTYAHSDGTPYKSAAGKTVNPSPLFITFGQEFVPATATDGQSRPVYLSRRRKLPFNGSTDIKGQDLKVFKNGVLLAQNSISASPSGAYGNYYLYASDWKTVVNATNAAAYIGFEASTNIGVEADSQIELVNVSLDHIGTSGISTRDNYLDGAYLPIYGIGLFSNYGSGSYPRNVSLYQGRMVFSGFPEQPLTVIFSNVLDSVTPGTNYNSFQIDVFATTDTDALDILLSSQPDDIVRGLVEWQNNIFVLTRKAVFRVYGNQNTLTQNNKFSVFVSNIGLVNPYCLVRTDRSVIYLSDIGVFDLALQESTTEYEAAEKSLKIRSRFGITSNPLYENLAWLAYDSNQRFVYVGLPILGSSFTSDVLLVYNTFRESWTEYTTPLGFNGYIATTYVDRSLGAGFILGCSNYRDSNNVPTDFLLLRFGAEKYSDFTEYYTGTGGTVSYDAPAESYIIHSTTDGVYEYPVTRSRSRQWRGFDLLPITSVQDCVVSLDGVEQVFQTDWAKYSNGNIYLFNDPGDGKLLRITTRRPVTDSQEGQFYYDVESPQSYDHTLVFVDNLLFSQYQDYSTTTSGSTYQVVLSAPSSSVVCIGQAYKVIYSSPVFTQRLLMKLKRVKHLYALFDNILAQDVYTVSDVNVQSGQRPDILVGRPKVRQNVNTAIKIDSEDGAESFYDLYGYGTLVWDDALFDVSSPSGAYRRDNLFKEALSGLGYGYQLLLWSYDEGAFTFSGYQIVAPVKGERFINWAR